MPHYAALFYQCGVNIHLADVVHDDGELDALAVVQYSVKQRGLATPKVARKQQYGQRVSLVSRAHMYCIVFGVSVYKNTQFV